MALTIEQRQAQLNRWKEGYIAAHPSLTPQQLAIVNGLEQLPDMLQYHTDTTMLRDESSRVMNAAQAAQAQATAAQTAAQQTSERMEQWYRENSARVGEQQQTLLRTQAALNSIATVYEVTPEDLARYGVTPGGTPTPPTPQPPAPGQPPYQPPSPSSSQLSATGAAPVFGQQPQQPAPDVATLVNQAVGQVAQRFVGAIAERDQVASRHFDLTGKMLDSAGVIQFMQTNNVQDYTEAWKQMHNISALEQTRTQAAQQAHDDAIRADERAKNAAAQGAPGNPNPRFDQSRVLTQFSPSAQTPTVGADGQPVERAGSQSRVSAVAGAYAQRLANRNASGTGAGAGAGTP